MSTSMHPGVVDSAEHAHPPPAGAHAGAHAGSTDARRQALRHRAALAGALASALVAVAFFNHAMVPGTDGVLAPWLAVVAGLGAGAGSLLLGRVAYLAAPDDEHESDVH